ncbi:MULTISPECIES: DUF2840 domain-containing protein [Methylocystis]|uniref:DUF2840 domain-containing protein n=1 Tax=Methylocystis rosea TaxID=173366 RepID=A0A3G8MC71_9HYPH|nr:MULTISPECIES: DUF2840 domain-containing protein [Methylocystis]AZG78398.1 DUF2840 domain-containing protein [Methylocystis rosea]CCJ07299.1 Conserved hypothetical protein [Methylocystis sp. SC2]
MSALTEVELYFLKGKIERWIRFGTPISERTLDRRRRISTFAPDSIFAFMRWASNGHGTLVSRIDILRACHVGEPCSTVPGVRPGAEILLRSVGWDKVQRVLRAIDAVEALGFAPQEICPDHWRHVHNRLAAGLSPRPYSRERHRAWLLRSKIEV